MRTRWRILLATVPMVIVLDQLSKWLVNRTIPLDGSVPVLPGFFNLVNIRNRGAAFGFLNRSDIDWHLWFFLAATIVACLIIVQLIRKSGEAVEAEGEAVDGRAARRGAGHRAQGLVGPSHRAQAVRVGDRRLDCARSELCGALGMGERAVEAAGEREPELEDRRVLVREEVGVRDEAHSTTVGTVEVVGHALGNGAEVAVGSPLVVVIGAARLDGRERVLEQARHPRELLVVRLASRGDAGPRLAHGALERRAADEALDEVVGVLHVELAGDQGARRALAGLDDRGVRGGRAQLGEGRHSTLRRVSEPAEVVRDALPRVKAHHALRDAELGAPVRPAGAHDRLGAGLVGELHRPIALGRAQLGVDKRQQRRDGGEPAIRSGAEAQLGGGLGQAALARSGRHALDRGAREVRGEDAVDASILVAVDDHAANRRRGGKRRAGNEQRQVIRVGSGERGALRLGDKGEGHRPGHGHPHPEQALGDVEPEVRDHAEGHRQVLQGIGKGHAHGPLAPGLGTLGCGGKEAAARMAHGLQAGDAGEKNVQPLVQRGDRLGHPGSVLSEVEGRLDGPDAVRVLRC